MPLLGDGKVREHHSEAVAELLKSSYCGDVPWRCSPPPCSFTVQVGSVPTLLLAVTQGIGPNHSRAGVKCLGGAAASLPMLGASDHLPCSCHVPGPQCLLHVVTESS